MIILFPADAHAVLGRSPTHSWAALQPVPLPDGTYILPEACLTDPAHADVHDILVACDIMLDSALIPFDFGDPEQKAAYEAAKLDYKTAGTRPTEAGAKEASVK